MDMPEPCPQAALWEVRKAGLNIMMSMKGDGKPVSFIEDCAVPPETPAHYPDRLAEAVVRILRERPRSNGYEVALREVGTEATSRLLDSLYRHVAGMG